MSIAVKYEARQYREAVSDADAAIRRFPDQPSFYYLRAVAREDLKEWNGAIADYDVYLKLLPNQHNALFRKALCYQQSNRLAEAIAAYTESLNCFGVIDTPLGKIHEDVMRLRGREPGNNWFKIGKEQILNNRGGLLIQRGDIEKGARDLADAIKTNVNYPIPHRVLGALMLQQGLAAEGISELKFAARLGDQQSIMLLRQLGQG